MAVIVFVDNVQLTLNARWVLSAMKRFVNRSIVVWMMTAHSQLVVLTRFVCRLNAEQVCLAQTDFCVAIRFANQPIAVGRIRTAKIVKFVRMANVYRA